MRDDLAETGAALDDEQGAFRNAPDASNERLRAALFALYEQAAWWAKALGSMGAPLTRESGLMRAIAIAERVLSGEVPSRPDAVILRSDAHAPGNWRRHDRVALYWPESEAYRRYMRVGREVRRGICRRVV